jgi:hypothetical protein
VDLGVDDLFDDGGVHFRGPLVVRYVSGQNSVEFANVGLVSVSFTWGILTAATVNPHEKALDSAATVNLCDLIVQRLSIDAPLFRADVSRDFRSLRDTLAAGAVPARLPPWRFPGRVGPDAITVGVRPLESLPTSSAKYVVRLYVVAIDFGNETISDDAYHRMKAARQRAFPGQERRILLRDYPPQERPW